MQREPNSKLEWLSPKSWADCDWGCFYCHIRAPWQQLLSQTWHLVVTSGKKASTSRNLVKQGWVKSEPTFLPSVCSEGCLWHTAVCWWENPVKNRGSPLYIMMTESWMTATHLHKHLKNTSLLVLLYKQLVLTRPSLCSAIVQESMKVCAMTESTASTWSDAWTSNINWGFFTMLIQKRRGRLRTQRGNGSFSKIDQMLL